VLTLGGRLAEDGTGDPLLDELTAVFEGAACPPAGASFAGAPILKRAARLALRAHVTPSIDTEVHKALRDVADDAAITVFAENVRKLEAHHAEQGERARGRRILVERADGFHGLKTLLPPPSRRALVLIDPPYEVKLDYKHVRDALEEALKRFPAGMYAVWYPVLQRMESRQFADRLKRLPAKEWLHVTLSVAGPRADGNGLHSSGMFILNPPYTLHDELLAVLPYLVDVLGQYDDANYLLEQKAA